METATITEPKVQTITPAVKNQLLGFVGRFSVPATESVSTMLEYNDRFTKHFSKNYMMLDLQRRPQPLPATTFDVWEMQPFLDPDSKDPKISGDATYEQIYDAFTLPIGRTLNDLAVTENRVLQILFDEGEELDKLRTALFGAVEVVNGHEGSGLSATGKKEMMNRWFHFLTLVQIKGANHFFPYAIYYHAKDLNWHFGVEQKRYPEVWKGQYQRRFIIPSLEG